jgi:hypothetical protein
MMRSSNRISGVKRVARGAARVFSLTVVASTLAGAQAPTNSNDDAQSSSGWHRDQCLGGLTYGGPLKLAVSWAGGLRKELASGQDVCAFVSPKIGLGGARLTTGVAKTFGTFGSGVAISGGVLRTFGAPSYADRMSTYAGGSLHVFPLLGIGLEIGSYHRLGGIEGQGRKSIIVWSAGIGF